MHRNFSKKQQNQMFLTDYKSAFFAFDINYNNKNMKYFKIFEFYYNYSNQIALLKFFWLIFVNFLYENKFLRQEMNSLIDYLLNGIKSFNIFIIVYSILYIAHKYWSHFGVIEDYWLTVYCLLKIIRELWTFMIT